MNQKTEDYKLLKDFVVLVRDILYSDEFRKMKKYKHHVKGNLYDHSVKVAYLCYKHHRRFGLKTDISELVRGAMLHDYYLYDLHGDRATHKFHWFRHPQKALENALAQYDLTDTQRDMIKHHMFPLTPVPPSTKAGWLICFYDKLAAVSDRFGENKWELAQIYCRKNKNRVLYNIL